MADTLGVELAVVVDRLVEEDEAVVDVVVLASMLDSVQLVGQGVVVKT